MNKKLLFAAISLASLTACNSDDFESQQIAEQAVSPIKFKVLNNDDAQTRASMGGTSGNKVVWNANEGDIFTLYHGAAADAVSGFENACYKAEYGEDGATLSTPTMIKEGRAIMVWPVDTTFRIKPGNNLTLVIPEVLEAKDKKTGKGGVENAVPYVSDLVNIKAYDPTGTGAQIGWKNTAGKDREYPVYMRPMGSILNLKAEWANKDKIDDLTKLAKDPIAPITLKSVKLLTDNDGNTKFTTVLPIKFTLPGAMVPAIPDEQWDIAHTDRAWEKVTDIDLASADKVSKAELTTKCIPGTELARFVILPQNEIDVTTGVEKAAVEVNTYYGRVLVANAAGGGRYTADEYATAWYRYLSTPAAETADENASEAAVETEGDNAGKFKTIAKGVNMGMRQTINFFSSYKAKSGVVKDEPTGTAVSRYVKINLDYLDMSNLHIENDKQLRDVVRVWDALGLGGVTVYLDGDADDVFEISQKTIETINNINKKKDSFAKWFKVKPCKVADEECATILVKGGGDVQDVAFIADNGGTMVDVVFNEGETWNWKGAVKVEATAVTRFVNKGTLANAETATLQTTDNAGNENNVRITNNGIWNITAGTLTVKFDVYNRDGGVVNISKGAQYRQDEYKSGLLTKFYNYATAVPSRFGGDDTKIGVVNNSGVFAAMNKAEIRNWGGLIKHADPDAKTFITSNQTGGDFSSKFSGTNKMGMIELPYTNKDENNISISAAADQGFVAIVVDATTAPGTELNNTAVGEFVNYIIINGGIATITNLADKIKYVEINDKTKEIYWQLDPEKPAPNYTGLMVLSDVNITLGTQVTATTTYLDEDATMYVAGKYNKAAIGTIPATQWNGYYGNTSDNVTTNYVYFGGL